MGKDRVSDVTSEQADRLCRAADAAIHAVNAAQVQGWGWVDPVRLWGSLIGDRWMVGFKIHEIVEARAFLERLGIAPWRFSE